MQPSWVKSADGDTDFPIQNLPYGVFDTGDTPRVGVAIGDMILDIAKIDHGIDPALFEAPSWNRVMLAGPEIWSKLRKRLTDLLTDERHKPYIEPYLSPQSTANLHLPFEVSEFTDFYASKAHASNVGTMFRGPENALPPNWLSMPIGYNGRASSVVVSGRDVRRPWGQIRRPDAQAPEFLPSARFDFELELGAIIGQNSQGFISLDAAEDMIFGYVLLNDWSARDIQAWEYQPLGPFQSKATATTISPWIVTKDALERFRAPLPNRERKLLPYLDTNRDLLYDIDLQVTLCPEGGAPTTITRTNFKEMYYAPAQQLCHHTCSGCPMRVGDLLGSGTISGAKPDERGALLELSWNGTTPVTLNNGDKRSFLEDGDEVIFRGAAHGDGYRIGFGECRGRVAAASDLPVWAKT